MKKNLCARSLEQANPVAQISNIFLLLCVTPDTGKLKGPRIKRKSVPFETNNYSFPFNKSFYDHKTRANIKKHGVFFPERDAGDDAGNI